ncbi:MAG: Dihydrolipoamide dehydrogenase of pyruvate dehydrogenase complex, partial [uncultured Sphingomonadaceae bacterium]
GLRPRRLCGRDPGVPARAQDSHRRARAAGRRLPELGLHSHQGLAQVGRAVRDPVAPEGLWAVRREAGLRLRGRRAAFARGGQTAQRRRRLPHEEAQDRGHRRPGAVRARRGRPGGCGQVEQGRLGASRPRQVGDPGHGRPRAHPSPDRDGAGRGADLDLSRGHDAEVRAQVPGGDRLRRDRHRIRQLLPGAGRGGHGDRGAGPDPAGRGRRDRKGRAQGVREARAQVPHERQGEPAGARRRGRGARRRVRRQGRTAARRGGHRGDRHRGQCGEHRAGGPGASGRTRPGGHRPSRRNQRCGPVRHRRRRGRALAGPQGLSRGHPHRGAHRRRARHGADQGADPRLHLFPAADRVGRPDGGTGQGGRAETQGRALPFPGERQGHRLRRDGGPGQDHLRRGHGSPHRRSHVGRGSHGDDSGFRPGHHPGGDRGRAARHRVPASDHVRGHARKHARRLRPRSAHL